MFLYQSDLVAGFKLMTIYIVHGMTVHIALLSPSCQAAYCCGILPMERMEPSFCPATLVIMEEL